MKKENPKANKLLAVMVSATLATGMVPAVAFSVAGLKVLALNLS